MKALHDMTRSELEREAAKADKLYSAILDEMIAAGRGHERPSETRMKKDSLSLRFIASLCLCQDFVQESRRRMEYHGNLNKT